MLTKIGSLYFDKLMNDVTLIVGGVEYPTHKLILSASSDVFQVRFFELYSRFLKINKRKYKKIIS